MHLRGDLVASISVSGDQRWRVSGWMLENCCYNPLHSEARYTSRIEPPQQEKDSSASSWLPPPKLIATFPIRGFCYLVECDSEILVAVSISTRPSQFSVCPCDIHYIGGNALFLHGRGTLSVHSKALQTIYFAIPPKHCQPHAHKSLYHHLPSHHLLLLSPPVPVGTRNKGQIIGQGERKTRWRVKGKFRLGVSVTCHTLSLF
ncbi:hypothetical protein SEVIR_1G382150v4 [Setaria viridis]